MATIVLQLRLTQVHKRTDFLEKQFFAFRNRVDSFVLLASDSLTWTLDENGFSTLLNCGCVSRPLPTALYGCMCVRVSLSTEHKKCPEIKYKYYIQWENLMGSPAGNNVAGGLQIGVGYIRSVANLQTQRMSTCIPCSPVQFGFPVKLDWN